VSLTDRLLEPILRDDAARPLITFYDDADGSRIELSAATLANWAAKTANWLRDECDVRPGDRVHVALPAHWQTAGALLGAWWCGANVVDEPAGAAVSLVAPECLTDAGRAAGAGRAASRAADAAVAVRAVVSLDPLGRGLATTPDGALDWITEMRVHGDFFHPDEPVPAGTPALLGASVATVHERAVARAAELGIAAGDRVLSTVDWTLPDGLLDGLLSVLAAPASLVYCANSDEAALDDRATIEKVTLWPKRGAGP
jgi:uncharacterized protein (TIGR03089 family)